MLQINKSSDHLYWEQAHQLQTDNSVHQDEKARIEYIWLVRSIKKFYGHYERPHSVRIKFQMLEINMELNCLSLFACLLQSPAWKIIVINISQCNIVVGFYLASLEVDSIAEGKKSITWKRLVLCVSVCDGIRNEKKNCALNTVAS